jgi:hypothetical protein
MTALETFTTASKQPLTTGRRPDMTGICALRPSKAADSNGQNPLIAGGPDLSALIRIRDRLAAHAGALAPTARWCVCPHLHQRRSFAPRSLRSLLAASQGPSKTLRILKPSLRKYTIEFSSRRARVSFELHDRRPIVAAIERAVLDPSPETYVVPQFSPDL